MTAVATGGPVAISVAAGGGWQFYGGGIFDGKGFLGGCGYHVDHGVQLVGYGGNVNATSKADRGYWWVRNSWGERWGESGYIRLQRHGEGAEPCGEDRARTITCAGQKKTPVKYCGVCAVLSLSLFPTGVAPVNAMQG